MKLIKTGKDAREAVKRGIDKAEKIIRSTLGPMGKNYLIGRVGMTPLISNDGAILSLELESENEFEQAGMDLVKELTQIASIRIKGATTTATILYRGIIDEAVKILDESSSIIGSRVHVINLKKAIQKQCDRACELIEKKSRPIKVEEIYNVALTAGEYEWIATMCQDIVSQIGKDGHVKIIDGPTTEYNVYKGMEVAAGYPSDDFVNSDGKCVLESPAIIVFDKKENDDYLIDIVREMDKLGHKNIVFIGPDFSQIFLDSLVELKKKSNTVCVALKVPSYGKKDIFEDVECFIGTSTVITRAVISSGSTFLIGGKGDTASRVKELERQKSQTESALDKDKLEHRIANLSGGIAIIKVGAPSEVDRSYLKKKLEDAINASQQALAHGVVRGGGQALYEVAKEMTGDTLLPTVLKIPFNTIQDSFGEKTEIPESVIDSTRITVDVLKLACSSASTFITVDSAVVVKNKKEDDQS